MTPQTVTIRILRKHSERIQFSKELYDRNPQEWEVETRQGEPAKILTTEWNQECCVVYNTKHFGRECNANGFYYQSESPTQFDLFMRRKSDDSMLPEERWLNIYPIGSMATYDSKYNADRLSGSERIALVHVTYAWEDQPWTDPNHRPATGGCMWTWIYSNLYWT